MLFSLAGAAALLAYALVPIGPAQPVLYLAMEASAVVAILWLTSRGLRSGSRGWILLGVGQALFLIGDAVWFGAAVSVGDDPGYPFLADLFYLSAYPLLAAGLWNLSRRDREASRWAWIDAGIIFAALMAVAWMVSIEPQLRDTSLSVPAQLVSVTYPLLDAFLLASAARILFTQAVPSASAGLLFAAFLSLWVGDSGYSGLVLSQTYQAGALLDLTWLAWAVLLGTAALHPSTRQSEITPQSRRWEPYGSTRLFVLGLVSLLPPVIVIVESAGGPWRGHEVLGSISLVLFVLVLLRMAALIGELRRRGEALRQEHTSLKEGEANLAETVERLRNTDSQRRALVSKLVLAHEEERRRVAGDLHDDTVQVIASVALQADVLAHRFIHPEEAKLVGELGETARMALGRLRTMMFELRPQSLDLGLTEALDEYLDRMREEAEISARLDARNELRPSEEARLILYRIAQEALVNVRKHAAATHVEIRIDQMNGGFRLAIEDDGRGFSPDQADASPEGHLGLTAMRERAEMADGWLKVKSAPGRGTTVEFWVPDRRLADAASVNKDLGASTVARPGGQGNLGRNRTGGEDTPSVGNRVTRVLIADDEPIVRKVLADAIALDDAVEVVGEAEDAHQAIELARLRRPDVAILDTKMPGGGGPAAARGIRRSSPSTHLLAFSAHQDESSVNSMLREGVSGYVVKGAGIAEISEALRRCAAGDTYLSPAVATRVVRDLASTFEGQDPKAGPHPGWEERIRRALTGNDGLRMVYQPIVHLPTGQVVGVEALARFVGEPVYPPDRWFAEAQRVGLGIDLEVHAIAAALPNVHRLPDGLYLGVNVSPEALASNLFSKAVGSAPAQQMVVEITEHARISDYEALRETLAEMRKAGFRLAIDDAGAGFASLRHILELAPDFIKLDTSLTERIDSEPSQRALTTALTYFGQEIGATVVAEGIESAEQAEWLLQHGVLFGQGYHLGRPGPLSDLFDSDRFDHASTSKTQAPRG